MASVAGDLDAEKFGANASVSTHYTYNGDGTLATAVKTYNDGTTTFVWTRSYTYAAGVLTDISIWVRS